jgi:hypothetical protein
MRTHEAITLVKTLRPRFFIPDQLGDIRASGLLPKLIQSGVALTNFVFELARSGMTAQLLIPAPGEKSGSGIKHSASLKLTALA